MEGRLTVSEMGGGPINLETMETRIREACASSSSSLLIERIELEAVPVGDGVRFQEVVDALRRSDESLGVVLRQYEAAGAFTVVYTAGKPWAGADDTHHEYTPEFRTDPSHQELKRQLGGSNVLRRANERDTRPLFEKYQFFTPGEYSRPRPSSGWFQD